MPPSAIRLPPSAAADKTVRPDMHYESSPTSPGPCSRGWLPNPVNACLSVSRSGAVFSPVLLICSSFMSRPRTRKGHEAQYCLRVPLGKPPAVCLPCDGSPAFTCIGNQGIKYVHVLVETSTLNNNLQPAALPIYNADTTLSLQRPDTHFRVP